MSSKLTTPSASTGALSGALQGVDVASFQHPNGAAISWADVAAAGIQFAAVKATEGAHYPNPYALADLANAQAAGLSTVAYAFASPNGNGAVPAGAGTRLVNPASDLCLADPGDATVLMLQVEMVTGVRFAAWLSPARPGTRE